MTTATLLSSPADGSAMPTVLMPDGPAHVAYSLAQGILIGARRAPGERGRIRPGGLQLWVMPFALTGDAQPRHFLDFGTQQIGVRFSPDGLWVAYSASGPNRQEQEIYVVRYPGPGERVTVSAGGARSPRWSANGRELYYRNGRKMMVVEIPPGAAFRPSAPRMLFETTYPSLSFDVLPDKRFLMIQIPEATATARERPAEMHIIVNWLEELKRQISAGK